MRRQWSYVFVLVVYISSGQGSEVSEKIKKIQPVQSQTYQARESDMDGQQTPDPVFESSPYQPTGLLLNVDFENEKVKRVKDQKQTYDLLELQKLDGVIAPFAIYYEGGNDDDRHARITVDPNDEDNHVLHYWLKNARIPVPGKGRFKGRIQLDLGVVERDSYFQRYRLFLHPDLDFYRQYPMENGWFGLSTLWMGAPWKGHEHPFKLSLNIGKNAGAGAPLLFIVSSAVHAGGEVRHGKWKAVWWKVATNFEIPVGKWIDVEIGYKAGDNKSGRFYMGVKTDNDRKYTTIFDITDWTYHPGSPKPVPVTNFQPLKLYSGSRLTEFVRKKGGVLQLYWDDFELYENW